MDVMYSGHRNISCQMNEWRYIGDSLFVECNTYYIRRNQGYKARLPWFMLEKRSNERPNFGWRQKFQSVFTWRNSILTFFSGNLTQFFIGCFRSPTDQYFENNSVAAEFSFSSNALGRQSNDIYGMLDSKWTLSVDYWSSKLSISYNYKFDG